MFIDTHCHLDHKDYENDLEEVLKESLEKGVTQCVIPGADMKDLNRAVEISEKFEGVFFAIGAHPYDVESFDESLFEKFVGHQKCVAIGECGLDYYRLPELNERENYKSKQKEVFTKQIEFSIQHNKPLIIHIREASFDSLNLLKSYPKAFGVLHCFNADNMLLELSDRFYYGIGGVSTFKNAKRLVEILPKIPKNRLLLETDSPYLTPHPFRGTRNSPTYIPLIAQKIAEIINIETEELASLSTHNAQTLFSFP
ncbi:TatD family hydrolase [Helicobacter pylori]|nr:TatD family hydrolase [Helicobacter pylori]WQW49548.1 TatD family hydrolase [Helicobacter pylori]WRE11971.1 TatD family hydrolase [Helicobacter pylori]